MDNYICINGKKAELTEEQMKALGIEISKNSPFNRVNKYEMFYYIGINGEVDFTRECNSNFNDKVFNVANHCTDKTIMEQRALHETLNRLMWRYSMEHDGDKIDWNDPNGVQWYILFDNLSKEFWVKHTYCCVEMGCIYFHTEAIAKTAITEIIEPFMKAHPEFKW